MAGRPPRYASGSARPSGSLRLWRRKDRARRARGLRDVALPEVLPIAAQLVIAKPVLQRLLVGEMAHHGVQLVEVPTSATRPLPVPLERARKARAKHG